MWNLHTPICSRQHRFNFFRFYHSVMSAPWKLLECLEVLKPQPLKSLLMSLPILAVIATIAHVARIAYEDRSWVALFFLFATIIQVWVLYKNSKCPYLPPTGGGGEGGTSASIVVNSRRNCSSVQEKAALPPPFPPDHKGSKKCRVR